MEVNDMPIGATRHNERDSEGQWWIVWGADFPQDEPGRKPHPESMFLEEAYKAGMEKVVEAIENDVIPMLLKMSSPNTAKDKWQAFKKSEGL